jgi:chitinase
MVPPGKTPLVVTSVPVGSATETFKRFVAPANLDGRVIVVSVARASADVEARTVVAVPLHTPVA